MNLKDINPNSLKIFLLDLQFKLRKVVEVKHDVRGHIMFRIYDDGEVEVSWYDPTYHENIFEGVHIDDLFKDIEELEARHQQKLLDQDREKERLKLLSEEKDKQSRRAQWEKLNKEFGSFS